MSVSRCQPRKIGRELCSCAGALVGLKLICLAIYCVKGRSRSAGHALKHGGRKMTDIGAPKNRNEYENEEMDLASLADDEIEYELDRVTIQIDDITRQLADKANIEGYAGSEIERWRNRAGNARRLFKRQRDELRIEAQRRGLNELLLTKEQRAALAYRKAKHEFRVASLLEIEREKEEVKREKEERHQKFMQDGAERRKIKLELKSARYELFIQSVYELLDRSEINKIWDHAKMNNLDHPAFAEKGLGEKTDD